MNEERMAFVDRAQKLANEIADLFAQAAYWNEAHPLEQPIDADPDGMMERLYDGLVDFVRRESRPTDKRLIRPLVKGGTNGR